MTTPPSRRSTCARCLRPGAAAAPVPASRVIVGESFAPDALAQALAAPWSDADRQAPHRALR